MIEAVENHMPEVIVIDEIGTEAEALAARTIAERGVQLIATAHGNTVDNLMANPTLSDLIGGISSVTISDEEARRRKTRKTILERKSPPTFDVLVEIQNREHMVVHYDLGHVVDAMLRGTPVEPEIRQRGDQGKIFTRKTDVPVFRQSFLHAAPNAAPGGAFQGIRIFTYGVSRKHTQRAISDLRAPAYLVSDMESADMVLTLKSQEKKKPLRLREVQKNGMPVHVIKSNTITQIENFLRSIFPESAAGKNPVAPKTFPDESAAEKEAAKAVIAVHKTGAPFELSPQNARFRRLQHEFINRQGLATESRGGAPTAGWWHTPCNFSLNALNHCNGIPLRIRGHNKTAHFRVFQFFYPACILFSRIEFRVIDSGDADALSGFIFVFIKRTGTDHLHFKDIPAQNIGYNTTKAVLHMLLPKKVCRACKRPLVWYRRKTDFGL